MLRWWHRSPCIPWLSSMVGNSLIPSLKVFICWKCCMIVHCSLFRALTSWYFAAFDFLQVHFQMHNEVILLLVRSDAQKIFRHAWSKFETWNLEEKALLLVYCIRWKNFKKLHEQFRPYVLKQRWALHILSVWGLVSIFAMIVDYIEFVFLVFEGLETNSHHRQNTCY